MADLVRTDLNKEQREEGKSYQQPCEGVLDRIDRKTAWGDVNEREHITNKMKLKQGHLKHLHVSKEVVTRHLYEETIQTLSGKSVH